MARPTKFDPKYHIPWAKSLMLRGCTIEELANHMGLAKSTVHKWMNENAEFSDAIKQGREYSDMQVELSLFKRATGVKITEKRTLVRTDENGKTVPARIEVLEKDVPADTTACIFWLKNRNPELWRDRTNVAIETTDDEVRDEIEEIVSRHKKKDVE